MKVIYAWACDFSSDSGEGNLSRQYLLKLLAINKNITVLVKTPFQDFRLERKKIFLIKTKKIDKKISFFHQFIYPMQGLIYLIFLNLLNKRTLYLNYLPLWNTILFLFLPKKCLMGPITGSNFNGRADNLSNLLRKYLLPFFYKISSIIIKYKNLNIILSTDILNEYFHSLNYRNYIDNFTDINLVKRKQTYKKKTIDFLIYYRIHANKGNDFHQFIIKKLKKNFKIFVFGDKLNIKDVVNLGNLSNKVVQKYLSISKYTILSKENRASLFALEARSNNLLIFYNKKLSTKKPLDTYYIPINYNNNLKVYHKINKEISLRNKSKYHKKNFVYNFLELKKKNLYNLYFDFFT